MRSEIEESRLKLTDAVQRAVEWVEVLDALDSADFIDDERTIDEDLRSLKSLLGRSASSLLNVAMLGSFSSGKGFLLSSLQGELNSVQIADENGLPTEEFVGLLPSASTPTTCCPVTVVPVTGSLDSSTPSAAKLRIRFIDAGSTWSEFRGALNTSVISAYATDSGRSSSFRQREHLGREVAEVEILVPDAPLPVKLYDLPGYGSGNPTHDQIIRRAAHDSDCFMYVSSAVKTLDETDHMNMQFIYEHCIARQKPVIWILSQIDRARQRDGGETTPVWMHTLEADNSYLRSTFTNSDFAGRGFVPVSPADEASARSMTSNPEFASKFEAASNMDTLREIMDEVIDSGAGLRRIAGISDDANSILRPYYRSIFELLTRYQTPLHELERQRDGWRRQVATLDAALEGVERRLESALQGRMKLVERAFRTLDNKLKDELRPRIDQADLRNHKDNSELEALRTRLAHRFLSDPSGAGTIWEREYATFKESVILEVRSTVQSADSVSSLTLDPDRITLNDLDMPLSRRQSRGSYDLVQRTAAFVGTMTPIVAGTAAGFGILAGTALLVPAGVTAAAALVYAMTKQRRSKASELEQLRADWLNQIDEYALAVKDSYLRAATAAGQLLISGSLEFLATRRAQALRNIAVVNDLLAQPENMDLSLRVSELSPLFEEVRGIVVALRDVARTEP